MIAADASLPSTFQPMPTPCRLSIIIATFNAQGTLEHCLDSVDAQCFRDFELLIVDGGSSDGTVPLIREREGRIAYWHSHPDRGIYDAWNQGLKQARGEYVCFLGADDAFHDPGSVKTLFDRIGDRHYDLVTSRGCQREAGHDNDPRIAGGPWNYRRLAYRIGLIHPGLLHRRGLFDEFGGFDASLRIVGDLEFLLRLPSTTATLDVSVVTVDIGQGGVSQRQFWRRLRERREIHRRSPRIGPWRAWLYWLDKAWRRPIALALRLPH